MKIYLRVQEIWRGHESVMEGLTDEGHSQNPPSPSRWGINNTRDMLRTQLF